MYQNGYLVVERYFFFDFCMCHTIIWRVRPHLCFSFILSTEHKHRKKNLPTLTCVDLDRAESKLQCLWDDLPMPSPVSSIFLNRCPIVGRNLGPRRAHITPPPHHTNMQLTFEKHHKHRIPSCHLVKDEGNWELWTRLSRDITGCHHIPCLSVEQPTSASSFDQFLLFWNTFLKDAPYIRLLRPIQFLWNALTSWTYRHRNLNPDSWLGAGVRGEQGKVAYWTDTSFPLKQ